MCLKRLFYLEKDFYKYKYHKVKGEESGYLEIVHYQCYVITLSTDLSCFVYTATDISWSLI